MIRRRLEHSYPGDEHLVAEGGGNFVAVLAGYKGTQEGRWDLGGTIPAFREEGGFRLPGCFLGGERANRGVMGDVGQRDHTGAVGAHAGRPRRAGLAASGRSLQSWLAVEPRTRMSAS